MPDCSICCETAEKLYNLCSSCSGDDKLICGNCSGKLIEYSGAASLFQNYLKVYISCPFCREKMTFNQIENTEFGKSYQFFREISVAFHKIINLLLVDRASMNQITRRMGIQLNIIHQMEAASDQWWIERDERGQYFDPSSTATMSEAEQLESIFGNNLQENLVQALLRPERGRVMYTSGSESDSAASESIDGS